jgi:predicted pyridoxine 5'-phosphate oxidase superfamily flavin-nucleotide-binding protein
MDISPKGDAPGLVKVLDKHTVVIPDRLGNQRADAFRSIRENPNVGSLFMVPKRREVSRARAEGGCPGRWRGQAKKKARRQVRPGVCLP